MVQSKKIFFQIPVYQQFLNNTYKKYFIDYNNFSSSLYKNKDFILNERENICSEIQKNICKKNINTFKITPNIPNVILLEYYLKNIDMFIYECKYWKITIEKYGNNFNIVIVKGKFLCQKKQIKKIIKNFKENDIIFEIRNKIKKKKNNGFRYYNSIKKY